MLELRSKPAAQVIAPLAELLTSNSVRYGKSWIDKGACRLTWEKLKRRDFVYQALWLGYPPFVILLFIANLIWGPSGWFALPAIVWFAAIGGVTIIHAMTDFPVCGDLYFERIGFTLACKHCGAKPPSI